MKSILIIAQLLFAMMVGAQKYSAPFGELPDAEIREALNMKNYAAEPGTEALALYRSVNVQLSSDGTRLTYLYRTKIFNSNAFGKWSDQVINVRSEGITTIKGHSYNLVDGQVVKRSLDESNILKKKLNQSWDSYTIAMPNVREGSVIEYSYVTTMQLWWLPSWDFQLDIPCLHSELLLDNHTVGFRAEVVGRLDVRHEKSRKQIHRWSISNVPSFREEPYMPNPDLFASSLMLWQYERPWNENADLIYWKKTFLRLNCPEREKVDELMDSVESPETRVRMLVNYVKENVEWNGVEDIFAANFDDVLKNKRGTAADINLLLTVMLSRAGINASPVLLSTRDNGHHHEDIPTIMQFNYVIAQAVVGMDTLYLDATEDKLQYDALPVRCLNGRGLLVNKNETMWITIDPRAKRKMNVEGDFSVDETGEMKGTLSVTRDGYEAWYSRMDFERLGENYYRERLNNSWQIRQKVVQNENSTDLSFIESYNVLVPDHVNVAESRMYINPYVLPYVTTNPFKADQRLYPVQFDVPVEATLLCNITLPKGYAIEELPQSRVIALPGNAVRAIFNISSDSDTRVQVMTRIQINRTLFLPEEYAQLKEFYTRLFAKQGEEIVLLKK